MMGTVLIALSRSAANYSGYRIVDAGGSATVTNNLGCMQWWQRVLRVVQQGVVHPNGLYAGAPCLCLRWVRFRDQGLAGGFFVIVGGFVFVSMVVALCQAVQLFDRKIMYLHNQQKKAGST
jgi:hypothetical protein